MTRIYSSALGVDLIDQDDDGRLDGMSTSRSAEAATVVESEKSLSVLDFQSQMATRFFSPLIYKKGRFDENVLSLKGLQIDSLNEYLYQMQIYHLHPLQETIEDTAEGYLRNGDAIGYAEYLTENYVPEAHYPIVNPSLAAVRAATEAGLDLAMVHRDVIDETRTYAQTVLEQAVRDTVNLRDQKSLLNEAFSTVAMIGETTIHGYSKEEWDVIFELDQNLLKIRDADSNFPSLSSTVVQIQQCRGRVLKLKSKELQEFSPYAELSISVVTSLNAHSRILSGKQLSSRIKERVYTFIAEALAEWYHVQIVQAYKHSQESIRPNTPYYWHRLATGLQDIPEDVSSFFIQAYEKLYSESIYSAIERGLVFDLEQSRDVKLSMAHMMNADEWLCDAMDFEIELLETGNHPQNQIDWQKEIQMACDASQECVTEAVQIRFQRIQQLATTGKPFREFQ